MYAAIKRKFWGKIENKAGTRENSNLKISEESNIQKNKCSVFLC